MGGGNQAVAGDAVGLIPAGIGPPHRQPYGNPAEQKLIDQIQHERSGSQAVGVHAQQHGDALPPGRQMDLHQSEEVPAGEQQDVGFLAVGTEAQFPPGPGQPYPRIAVDDAAPPGTAGPVPAIAVEQGHVPGEGLAEAQSLGFGTGEGEVEHVDLQGGVDRQALEQGGVVLHRMAAGDQQPERTAPDQPGALTLQVQGPHQAANLCQQGGRDPPRIAQMVAGAYRSDQVPHAAHQGLG